MMDVCPGCGYERIEQKSSGGLNVFLCGSSHYKDSSVEKFDQVPFCRVMQLENAIKLVCNQKADDKCWMDLKLLADLVGVELDMRVGDPEAMLKNCDRYVRSVCVAGGPWKTYAELEARIEVLTRELEAQQQSANYIARIEVLTRELDAQRQAASYIAKQRDAAEWIVRAIMTVMTTPEHRDEATELYRRGFSDGQFDLQKNDISDRPLGAGSSE